MNSKLKKSFSLVAAAAMTAVALTSVSAPISALDGGEVIFTSEAEILEGAELWTDIYGKEFPGYSGEGFAYLTNKEITFEVEAPEEGMYEISTRYTQINDTGGRKQTISVNGQDFMVDFPYADQWTDTSFGLFRLKEGANTIVLKTSYGYASYDTITVSKAVPNDYGKATGETCDPDATPETKALMQYLKSVYGEHIISGQQEIYGGGNQTFTTIQYNANTDTCTDSDGNTYTFDEESKAKADDGSTFVWTCYGADGQAYSYDTQSRRYYYNDYDLEFDFVYDLSGEYPAIRGFDFMNYNPLYGWNDGTTERVIDWVKERNGIATACWHINIPSDFASWEVGDTLDWTKCTYGADSDFDTSQAVIDGTKENAYVLSAIKMLAEQLSILQDEGVPVIFRPFHEAEGNGGLDGAGAWFWWSKSGAEVYKELWKLLYTELTETYGLHNIIWEENLYAWSDDSAKWYVGDEYVDIVGFDKYNVEYNRHDGNPSNSGPNEDAESSIFNSLMRFVDGGKMVSMPENDTIPGLNNLLTEDAGWLYFCPWYGDHILSSAKNDPDTVKEMYQSDYCITLGELPEDLYSGGHDIPTKPTGETVYGDADLSGDIEIADAVKVLCYVTDSENNPMEEQAIINADVYQTGDGISAQDALSIQKYLAQIIKELPETGEE